MGKAMLEVFDKHSVPGPTCVAPVRAGTDNSCFGPADILALNSKE
jgi:hypothetical protein